MDTKHFVAYTDGGCDGNGFPNSLGGYGFVVIDQAGYEFTGHNQSAYVDVTNNQMELLAVIKALEWVESAAPGASVDIRTDSQLVIGWCSQNWRRNSEATKPYLEQLDELQSRLSVTFTKVKGHSGDKYNEMADQLAAIPINRALQELNRQPWEYRKKAKKVRARA